MYNILLPLLLGNEDTAPRRGPLSTECPNQMLRVRMLSIPRRQAMKSKIKSLLDTGDMLSPGRLRNTTGAKTAAIDTVMG